MRNFLVQQNPGLLPIDFPLCPLGADSLRRKTLALLGWPTFLYQGEAVKSTQAVVLGRGTVTAVTTSGVGNKIGVANGRNKPKLTLSPRPGPGSSGRQRWEVLPLPALSARFLLFRTFIYFGRLR